MLVRIYEWIMLKFFKRYITDQRRDAVKKTLVLLTECIRKDITSKGWKCDEDMIAKEYADIVDKNIEIILGVAKKIKPN